MHSCLALFILIIHLCLFFPSPLSFACSNIEHLDIMLIDWILHKEVDCNNTLTLSYVLLVYVIVFFLTMTIWFLKPEHLSTNFLGSVTFLCMYCDVTPFGKLTRLIVDNIPYPFSPAWSKNVVAREVVVPTQSWFILEDIPCLECFHMTLTNDHIAEILQYHPHLIGVLEC